MAVLPKHSAVATSGAGDALREGSPCLQTPIPCLGSFYQLRAVCERVGVRHVQLTRAAVEASLPMHGCWSCAA